MSRPFRLTVEEAERVWRNHDKLFTCCIDKPNSDCSLRKSHNEDVSRAMAEAHEREIQAWKKREGIA